jgi:hypothetical protein
MAPWRQIRQDWHAVTTVAVTKGDVSAEHDKEVSITQNAPPLVIK